MNGRKKGGFQKLGKTWPLYGGNFLGFGVKDWSKKGGGGEGLNTRWGGEKKTVPRERYYSPPLEGESLEGAGGLQPRKIREKAKQLFFGPNNDMSHTSWGQGFH